MNRLTKRLEDGQAIFHECHGTCGTCDGANCYCIGPMVDRLAAYEDTGLTDKNGKRIFEGDIVKTSDITHEGVIQIPGESFEIAMRKGCWVMVAGEDWNFLETNHECIQVIGNIHGNQELLKGGEG